MQTGFRFLALRAIQISGASLALAVALPALGDQSANPHVFPTTARPFGLGYAKWSAQWWKWALSRPVAGHPFVEPGFDCNGPNNGQHGPVWFLALSSAPPAVERICAIPEGTAVFVGIVNTECSSLEPTFPDGTGGQTETVQRDCANFFVNHVVVSSLFCTLDGEPVKHLGNFRFASSQFAFTAPSPWIFGDTGGAGTAVADGYYVMLKPLSSKAHTLSCGGSFHFAVAEGDPFDADLSFGNTYHLIVQGR